MDVKLTFFFGFLCIVTAKSNVRHPEFSKACQGPSEASGGSLQEMVSQLFPCNVPDVQSDQAGEEELSEPQQIFKQDVRYDAKRSSEIALSVLDLSHRILDDIMQDSSQDKYQVISPISIAAALQLALLGANGMTFNELMDVMGYNTKTFSQHPYQIHEEFGLLLEDLVNNSPNPTRYRENVPWRANASRHYVRKTMRHQSNLPNYDEHMISVANGIFVQRDFSIRDEYREVVQNIYRSKIQRLDFRGEPRASAKFINDWVNEKTHGKIKEVIQGSANPETRVILANALYFKAEWQETFIEGATAFKNFYPKGKDNDYTIMVEMMAHGGSFPHYYDEQSDCEILGLPYKQNSTTMYVILPKNSNSDKIRIAQRILTPERLEQIISKMRIKTAVILFPKMHLTGNLHLKKNFKEMGLSTLFEPQICDLSVMSQGYSEQSNGMNFSNSYLPTRRNAPEYLAIDPKESLIFTRSNREAGRKLKRDVTYKVKGENSKHNNPLSVKDFMLRKRIIKKNHGKKLRRSKRQFMQFAAEKLDSLRHRKDLVNPHLFADEIIHKVDLTINEKGTEGGAATAITLNRSGTNVVFRVDTPFMFLIRHDPTHVPLFYGLVIEPQN
ncbi:CLUMA_CG007486, isoform A [Clunio marinus]|uniref:CLUMA_CG007486, isoform A n=1 Tax=Clunio marinus TaxID=568069 RepID=A0A1J1I0V0_9DIPT|nr:CLUMA_CG007486, isoform A [Clunio marinus]